MLPLIGSDFRSRISVVLKSGLLRTLNILWEDFFDSSMASASIWLDLDMLEMVCVAVLDVPGNRGKWLGLRIGLFDSG